MTLLDPPGQGQPSRPSGQRSSRSNRPAVIGVAIVCLLLLVGLGSQLVRPSNNDAAGAPDDPAQPTAAATAAPIEPPVPEPEPTPPENSAAAASTASVDGGPTPTPTPPVYGGFFVAPQSGWEIAGQHIFRMTGPGIHLSESDPASSSFAFTPAGLLENPCWATDDERLWLITVDQENTLSMWDFVFETRWWTKFETQQLDLNGADSCKAELIDDQILVASSDTTGLSLALLTTSAEVVWQQRLDFPDSWIDQATVNSTYVTELLFDSDRLIVNLCVSVGEDRTCRPHLLTFDYQSLGPIDDWGVAFTGAVQHSPRYVGLTSSGFSGFGLDTSAIQLVEIEGEVWRIERQSRFNQDSAIWAAAPLDQDPVYVSEGIRPQLFAYEGTVAAVSISDLATSEHGVAGEPQWKIYSADGQWESFIGPQRRDLSEPGAVAATQGKASGLLQDPDGNWSLVLSSPDELAEIAAEAWRTTIVGDRVYFEGRGAIEIGSDKGQEFESVPLRDFRATVRCSTSAQGNFAAIVWPKADPYLFIDGPEGRREVPLAPNVEAPNPGFSNTIVGACRPLLLDDTWHVARLDTTNEVLSIFSIEPDDQIIEHTIDLSGEWFDAIPPWRTYQGRASMYQDGDRIVVQFCTSDESATCSFADLSFDRSLIEGDALRTSAAVEAARTPALFYPPNDHEFGAAEQLHQLGTELWRGDIDQPVGSCACGEGGDFVPYFSWVGGPFSGPAEVPSTRTVSYRLLSSQVFQCGSDEVPATADVRDDPDFVEPDATTFCQRVGDSSSTPRPLSELELPWTLAPERLEVDFSHRDQLGQVIVVPTAGQTGF